MTPPATSSPLLPMLLRAPGPMHVVPCFRHVGGAEDPSRHRIAARHAKKLPEWRLPCEVGWNWTLCASLPCREGPNEWVGSVVAGGGITWVSPGLMPQHLEIA